MKKLAERNPLLFYLCVGCVWTILLITHNSINHLDLVWDHALHETWMTLYLLFVHFILFEYSLPFISKKRNIFLTALFSVFLVCTYSFLLTVGMYGWNKLGIWLEIYPVLKIFNLLPHDPLRLMLIEAGDLGETGIASVLFFGIAKLFYGNYRLKQTAQQLRFERQEAELYYLRAQTNPHFLFNTLNNIYSLARDKSDLAPDSILRLAKILRFMLYETNGVYIRIEQEIQILEDYIALERLRYKNTLVLEFRKDVEDLNQQLPPLLMMPLVENAFKHGISESTGKQYVDIHLTVKNHQLVFIIKNSHEKPTDEPVKENIGLGNLRRQLGLLYADYNFNIQIEKYLFTATLTINLVSHV